MLGAKDAGWDAGSLVKRMVAFFRVSQNVYRTGRVKQREEGWSGKAKIRQPRVEKRGETE
jgi:hypothetical protein